MPRLSKVLQVFALASYGSLKVEQFGKATRCRMKSFIRLNQASLHGEVLKQLRGKAACHSWTS